MSAWPRVTRAPARRGTATGGGARLPPRRRTAPRPLALDGRPGDLRGQMEALARDWSPLSLAELVEGLAGGACPNGRSPSPSTTATPTTSRSRHRCSPSTGFRPRSSSPPASVDAGDPPWWDELASLLLEPARLPSTLTLSSGGHPWRIPPLPAGERCSSPNTPLPWNAEPGTRLRAFYEVWLALRALDAPAREATLDEIAEWAGTPRSSGRVVLTWEQVRAVRRSSRPRARSAHAHPPRPAKLLVARTPAPRSPAAPTGSAPKPASRWTSSPTPSAHGPRASRVLSPTSASVLPTRPPGMRPRGARRPTRSHACRLRTMLRATSPACWPACRAADPLGGPS